MKPVRATSGLIALCLITLPAIGDTRTWTDAATNRALEGEFVKVDGGNVVIRLANGRSVDVAINRLVDADRAFIEKQSAKPAGSATGPFAGITPPVSVKSLPVTGKGEDRVGGLEVTNNSEKAISSLVVGMFLFGQDGSIEKTVPHTNDGYFGERGTELGKGRDFVIELDDFWIKDNIASVAGLAKGLTWKDGTEWPAWTGPAPEQEGDAPVSLVMKGVLREADLAAPLIECFNHSNMGIKSLMYRLYYLDGEGNELNKGRRTGAGSTDGNIIEAGEGLALVGNEGPPKGAINVSLSLHSVKFEDGSEWTSGD